MVFKPTQINYTNTQINIVKYLYYYKIVIKTEFSCKFSKQHTEENNKRALVYRQRRNPQIPQTANYQ